MGKVAPARTVKRKSDARAPLASERPSRAESEDAVRTLIRWAGDNPQRPGMLGTPARVVRAYEEWFSGYAENPRDYLSRTFEEIAACLNSVLKPHGVAVVIEAAHQCMTTRGVHKSGVTMVTSQMLGVFRRRLETRHEFLSAINLRGAARL